LCLEAGNEYSSRSEVLYYRCEEPRGDTAAESLLDIEQQLGGPEVILKSFLSQAAKKGLVVAKKRPRGSSHPNLLAYLIDVLESTLETKTCRILLDVDSIEHITRLRIGDFTGMLARLLSGKLGKMCSVLLSGETIPDIMDALKGVPTVNQGTEVNGTVSSDATRVPRFIVLTQY
jgi:hypothetical protein